VIQMKA